MTGYLLSTIAAVLLCGALTGPMLAAQRRGWRPRTALFGAWCWATYALSFGWILATHGQSTGRALLLAAALSAALVPVWLWIDRRDRAPEQPAWVFPETPLLAQAPERSE